MGLWHRLGSIRRDLARGVFPHELSFFLDLPWRHLVLPPRTLAERLALPPSARVLEVGAGTGFYSAEVARRLPQGHLELLDLQPEMLARARRRLEAEGRRNTGYTLADARALPFAARTFDAVFLVTALGEISDPAAFLREARRVLRPGALLSVSERLPDPDFSSFTKIKTLVEREGFLFTRRHGAAWSYTANFRNPPTA